MMAVSHAHKVRKGPDASQRASRQTDPEHSLVSPGTPYGFSVAAAASGRHRMRARCCQLQ